MKYSNTIEYNINTKLDSSGLTKLQTQIKQLENSMQQMSNRDIINDEKVQAAKTQLEGLNKALTNSFDSSLGILDLAKFRSELDNSGVSAKGLQSAFNMMGAEGQAALGGLTTQIANFNGGMERTSSTVDKVFTTFSNTFRWGLVSSFFSQFMNAIHSSIDYVKELDDSLTQIMLVTDYNRDSMNEFAKSANEAAKAVSMTTTGMTNASLIFAQQGYDLGQSQELATLSAKLANASQQDTATTSDQITAYMNAYGLQDSMEELTQQMDNWALIANVSAADVSELAQASQRAASMANAVGVSGEGLAAQIATIESVTREAPEQIGNGLKTLYARFSDIKAGKTDEDGIDLGKVTAELDRIGVKVLDEFGNIREMDNIIEDLMDVWADLDDTAKMASAQALAGKYQVNRFFALMDNRDMYEQYVNATGKNATGTLDVMNEEYAQSIEGRSAKLQASLEGLFSTVFNTDDIYPWMDAAQGALDLLQQFFDSLGGGKTVLLGIVTLLSQAFNQNIARNINNMISNRNLGKKREQNINEVDDTLDRAGIDRTQGVGKYISDTASQAKLGALDSKQYDTYFNNVKQWSDASIALARSEEQLTDNINATNLVFGKMTNGGIKDAVTLTDKGVNSYNAADERARWSNSEIAKKAQELDFSDVFGQTRIIANGLKEVQEQFESTSKDTAQLEVAIDKVSMALTELESIQGYSPAASKKMQDGLEALRVEFEENEALTEASKKKLQDYIGEMERLSSTAANMDETKVRKIFADAGDSSQQLKGTVDFNQTQVDSIETKSLGDQKGIDQQQTIKGILDTLNAVQQLTFAWQAFQNLGSIWSNKDLTDGEKILQTIMNLSMAIPQLITGFSQIGDAAKLIKTTVTDAFIKMAESQQKDLLAEQEKTNATITAAEAEVQVAQAEVERAEVQLHNLTLLQQYQKGIVEKAQSELDGADATLVAAQAEREKAKALLESAEATLKARQAQGEKIRPQDLGDIQFAKQKLEQSDSGLDSARAQVAAAEKKLNDEIARGEKIQSAVAQGREALAKANNNLAESQQKLSKAQELGNQINSKIYTFEGKMTGVLSSVTNAWDIKNKVISAYAEKAGLAEGATVSFGTALKGLLELSNLSVGAIAGLGVALAGVIAIIGGVAWAINKEAEEQKAQAEAMQAITDQSTETVNKLNESRDSFNELYKSYKLTGEASDEFKAALQEQCDTLGITEGELLIAQGHYETLKEKIDEATKSAYDNNAALMQLNLEELESPINDMTKDQKEILEKAGITSHEEVSQIELNGAGLADMYGTPITQKNTVYDQSDYEQAKMVQDYIVQKQQEINDLTDKRIQAARDGDAQKIIAIDAELKSLALEVSKAEQVKSLYGDIVQQTEAIRDNQLDAELNDSDSIFKTGDYDEIKSFIELIGGETVDSSNIDELIQKYADLAGNEDVAAEAAENLKTQIESIKDPRQQNLNIDSYRTSEERQNVQKDLGLSDEEYEGYKNTLLDNEENVKALKDMRDAAIENADAIRKERKNLEEEIAKLEESKAKLEEKTKSLDDSSEKYKKNQEKIKKFTKEIDDNKKALEKIKKTQGDYDAQLSDLENRVIETAVGAQELGKIWEDNAKILRDSNSGWTEQAEAINALAPGLAHLLNMNLSDIEKLGSDFFTNTQNLNDMEAAINGDVEALQRLRGEAALAILVETGIDPESDIYEEASKLVDWANQNLPDLKIGTVIESGAFYDELNAMVQSMIAAGMDIDAIAEQLAMLGLSMEPDGTTSTIQVPAPEISFSESYSRARNDPGMREAAAASNQTLRAYVKEQYETMDVPNYKFTRISGDNFNGGSKPSSSGGGGGKSCFVAGTLVSTFLGFRPIEQIQKGDTVLSYNKSLELNEYSEVLQTMIHDTIEPIYTLYIKDEQLRVTGIHRFLVADKITYGVPQWVHAENLHVGQWVLFADGTWHVIHKIEVNIEHQIVYNFEVSGNHNYYVGRNQILAHNKGGGGKKGGGSGGKGSGGGKAKTIEPKDKKEHEKDYYEEVNTQLDKTEKILSRIEKEEDRLIGDKARANQNKQLSNLRKEIELQKEKQKIQQQELKDVDELMKKRAKEARDLAAKNGIMAIIPSPIYDKDGAIANYEEMSAAIDKIHNQFIDQYNAAAKAGDEELTKEIQKTIDEFDKYGEDLLKNAQRHDALQSEIEETKNALEELEDAMEDIRIKAYTASQEALDNLKDIKESAAELDKLFRDFDDDPFSMNRWSIDDTPYGDLIETLSKLDNIYAVSQEKARDFYDELINQKRAALAATIDEDEKDAIERAIQFFEEQKDRLSSSDLSNGLLGLSQQDLERLQGWMDNPEAEDNPFGKNTAALFDAYQDAYKRTLDLFEDYREIIQDTRDNILDIYSDAESSIQRQMDQYDRLIEKVERISDTYTLYYGEDSYDQLDQFYTRQGDIMQNQLNKLTEAYEYWQNQYKKALAVGDQELIKEIQDKMNDAEDEMLNAAQELADLWVEKFENAVEASSQHIFKDLFGTNDIDELTDNWELQKDYMERYKDDVEKAYEIDKLRNKYLDLLDEAQGSSAQTQNRIRQQMEDQLKLLQNQTTVSEYDVKLANAKLEILQKQIALEDAQRNKNKMQLRRDTQGNYRYVYTADQGDVRESQQDLEDSEYNAYEMTKNETVNNNDRAIGMLQDYIEKRAAIWNKYKDDNTARAKALADLEAEYSKIFEALAEDFTDTSEGMSDILNWLVQNGTENTTTAAIDMLNTLYDENGKIKDQTGQDWMDMASLIQDQVLPGIQDSVDKANLEMVNQATELKDAMTGPDGALTKIGSGADNVEDSMTKAASATSDLATATEELFNALGADDSKLQLALDKLADYEKQLQSTQASTSQLSTQLSQANKTIAAKNAEALHYKTALDFATGAKDVKVGTVVKLKKGTKVHYSRNDSQTDSDHKYGWSLPADMWVQFYEIDKGQKNPYGFYATGDSLKKFGPTQNQDGSDDRGGEAPTSQRQHQRWWFSQEELQKNVLDAMDTGGYTGDWNESTSLYKNGKIAMLHQKELVLNATDTENILAAVNIMREITDAIKMSTNYMSALKSNTYSVNNTEPIQQRVEISATFPNVSSITDIEQALLNISDQAYIYANKTI